MKEPSSQQQGKWYCPECKIYTSDNTVHSSCGTALEYDPMEAPDLNFDSQQQEEEKCPPGCMRYTGGEIKHIPQCCFYPDSLSKLFDENQKSFREKLHRMRKAIKIIEAERDALKSEVDKLKMSLNLRDSYGFDEDEIGY